MLEPSRDSRAPKKRTSRLSLKKPRPTSMPRHRNQLKCHHTGPLWGRSYLKPTTRNSKNWTIPESPSSRKNKLLPLSKVKLNNTLSVGRTVLFLKDNRKKRPRQSFSRKGWHRSIKLLTSKRKMTREPSIKRRLRLELLSEPSKRRSSRLKLTKVKHSRGRLGPSRAANKIN